MTETDLSPLSALLQDRAATAWSEVRPSETALPDRAPRDVR